MQKLGLASHTVFLSLHGLSLKMLSEVRCRSEKENQSDCYIEVRAGSGGTESMDWALMLTNVHLPPRHIYRERDRTEVL
jgi:protein subunit release factor A